MWSFRGNEKMVSINKVALAFISSIELPQGFMNVVKSAGNRFRYAFHVEFPSSIEWRSFNHPDFDKDKRHRTKDEYAFVSADYKKIYVNIEKIQKDNIPYQEIIVHEMGHFLDRHLGKGPYFSETLKISDKAPEVFAMMVDFVVNKDSTGGPIQTKMYEAACDKLGMNDRIKKASVDLTIRLMLKDAQRIISKIKSELVGPSPDPVNLKSLVNSLEKTITAIHG
jgi:hypothetical protein